MASGVGVAGVVTSCPPVMWLVKSWSPYSTPRQLLRSRPCPSLANSPKGGQPFRSAWRSLCSDLPAAGPFGVRRGETCTPAAHGLLLLLYMLFVVIRQSRKARRWPLGLALYYFPPRGFPRRVPRPRTSARGPWFLVETLSVLRCCHVPIVRRYGTGETERRSGRSFGCSGVGCSAFCTMYL